MSYTPPDGWVEDFTGGGVTLGRFQARTDCPRIRKPDQLRQVDRPYSALRCPGCADEYCRSVAEVARHVDLATLMPERG